MTQNINISLPDELYKKLQKVKERINVSGICQNALETEIEMCELKKKGNKMSTIEKLRGQKELYDQKYFEQGKADGIKDAPDMDYEELLEVVNSDERFYKTEYYENYLKDQIDELSKDDPAFNKLKYCEGWLEGVKEFFEDVKDELE